MAVPFIKNSFVSGEISPEMFGRTDIDKFASGASTMRNLFVNYRGGANSRAGTAFVGYSKQSGYLGTPPQVVQSETLIGGGTLTLPKPVGVGNYIVLTITGDVVNTPFESTFDFTYNANTGIWPNIASNIGTATSTTPPIITMENGGQAGSEQYSACLAEISGATGFSWTGGGASYSGGIITLPEIAVGQTPSLIYAATSIVGTHDPSGYNFRNPTPSGANISEFLYGAAGFEGAPYSEVIITLGGVIGPTTIAVESEVAPGAIGGAGNPQVSTAVIFVGTNTGGNPAPPRLIPFQFSVNQALMLEFGEYYMRVISDGAFVTEDPVDITGITQANPAVVSATATGASAATPVNTSVATSYAPGDEITVAGGNFTSPAVLEVQTTELLSVQLANPGLGYAPGDTIDLAGGGQTVAPVVAVATTQVNALPTIVAGGAAGTPGTATVTGTTGTGTKFQASVTISAGGIITAVDSVTVVGSYTVNPTNLASEPVTGGGLTGAILGVQMGIGSTTLTTAGAFSSNPAGGVLTQASTSGAGVGATFQSGLFAPLALAIVTAGTYSSFPPNPVGQASTTGSGSGVTFDFTSNAVIPYNNGDWVFFANVGGMTEINGRTFIVENATTDSFTLSDVFGNPVNSTGYDAYTGGGSGARIYTLATPYQAVDLPYLKFDQSADVKSFSIWNQETLTEYPPMDLTRLADNNWTIAEIAIGAQIAAPTGLALVANGGNTEQQLYQIYYYVTAVVAATGEESEPIMGGSTNGPLGATNTLTGDVFSNTLTWTAVPGADFYNVYAEIPIPFVGDEISTGSYGLPPTFIAGFVKQTIGASFTDNDVTPNFAQGPPQHQNPFSRGQIVAAPLVTGGKGYAGNGRNLLSTTATITTETGSGAVITPVFAGGSYPITSMYVQNAGIGYETGDTVAITGTGTGATATLTVGPETGTYPGVVSYFQERRVYGNTQNNPDTYFFSQSGLYLNFDMHFPTVANDAITGSPWAIEVNGIQWMINMPGGLVVLTGLGAWQLTGAGGSSLNPVPITPAAQQAQPQAFNGVSPIVPPIKIDYQILYVQVKGSIVREFSYQFYTNIYTGLDLTEISSQLFSGYLIREWAYAEEPYKVVWAVRNDGVMLSLTYLKAEAVSAWARHDTNGSFLSVASITELPVDAVYVATQRQIGDVKPFMIERMDNRVWQTIEDAWCVDAGLSMPMPEPAATLTVSSPIGAGALTGVTGLVGGKGYSAGTYAVINDANGQGIGSGAVAALTIVGGVITAIAFTAEGANYVAPSISFIDPANTGGGARAQIVLNNSATFSASLPVFIEGDVGSIIRSGGGIAEITAYVSATQVTANILVPISQIIPNSGTQTSLPLVAPQQSGNWTMTAPTTVVSGLYHLVGMEVTGLADGNVIPPQIVSENGTITLAAPASAIVVGLGFTAQLQSVYWDAGQGAVSQGRRKRIPAVTARIELSRDLMIGTNQLDGSTLSPQQIDVHWRNMTPVTNRRSKPYNGLTTPLFTGDVRLPVQGVSDTRGQVALQQTNPVPMNVLALIPEITEGDVEAGKTGTQPAGGGASDDAGTGFDFGYNPPTPASIQNA